jgi:hypothetical protein
LFAIWSTISLFGDDAARHAQTEHAERVADAVE